MEKTNKKGPKIANLIIGSVFALGACLTCFFGSDSTIRGSAEGITENPLPTVYSYYNFYQGWQFIVHKKEAKDYLFTESMPACIANKSGIDSTNTIYYDTKDEAGQLQSVAFSKEITSTLKNNRATVRIGAYTDHITLLQLQPTIVDKQDMKNSLALTYFKTRKPAKYSFAYSFRGKDGKLQNILISLSTELIEGYYTITEEAIEKAYEEYIYSNELIWESMKGRELANLEQANVYIRPTETYLGTFIYTYYYEGRDNIKGITVNDHIAHTIDYKHYESINLKGTLSFVNTFFSTEIFEGFTFGTLLFISVGGLLVGMLLKIFLGG